MVDGSPSSHQTSAHAASVPLMNLAPGTLAILREVLDNQSRAVLRSLGLTDGARLRVCRVGDPCIIQVRSTRIGLSRQVGQSVYVTIIEESAW